MDAVKQNDIDFRIGQCIDGDFSYWVSSRGGPSMPVERISGWSKRERVGERVVHLARD